MQRFGTSAIPTHSIGLAILRSDWRLATSLLLRPRPGEYSDTEAGRRAWLEEADLEKALQIIPRRCVAERCILENYKKHDGTDRNLLGGLSAVRLFWSECSLPLNDLSFYSFRFLETYA
jgi:tRNA pseudouridine13 synthase